MASMRILHIIKDDKFSNPIIEIFEKTSYVNTYVCVVKDGGCMNYAHSEKVMPIQESESWKLWCDKDIDVYMFHPIYAPTYDWVLSIPRDKIIIASSWGMDLYYSQANCPPCFL